MKDKRGISYAALHKVAKKHAIAEGLKGKRKKPEPNIPKKRRRGRIIEPSPEVISKITEISDDELRALYDEIPLERELGIRSLRDFAKICWSQIHPGDPFVEDAWHSDCLADHLEAVGRTQIKKLLISVPPGHGKSTWACVFLPVWMWINWPYKKMGFGSYSYDNVKRDAQYCIKLMKSNWFKARWGDKFDLVKTELRSVKTSMGGERAGMSVGGQTLGIRANDLIVADDPMNIDQVDSENARGTVHFWWEHGMRSRGDVRKCEIVIQQRLHDRDLIGYLQAEFGGYQELVLPSHYNPKRHCVTYASKINKETGMEENYKFWEDPRTEEGQLLFEARYPESHLAEQVGKTDSSRNTYCTPGESPILMADLSNKNIADIKPGDMVVGFTEADPKRRRRLCPTKVLNVYKYKNRLVNKLILDDGDEIRCTPEHKWFTGRAGNNKKDEHKEYLLVKIGSTLRKVTEARIPEVLDERAAGWLGGFYDAEGYTSTQGDIVITQGDGRNGPLCKKLEGVLEQFDIKYYKRLFKVGEGYNVWRYELKRAVPNRQKFLAYAKPIKWRHRIIDTVYQNGARFVIRKSKVVDIVPDGEETVYGLETETGNYVVWGYASSNSAMWEQDPVQPGGNIIKNHWLRYYPETPEERFKMCSRSILSCDTAVKDAATSSYTVIQIWGVKGPNLYLIDQLRRRLSFIGRIEALANMMQKWGINMPGPGLSARLIEDKAGGSDAIEVLQAKFPGLIAFDGNDDKVERMEAISWMFEAGNIYVPGRPPKEGQEGGVDFSYTPWMTEWVDEITRFPKAAYNDQAIAMSQALVYISRSLKNMLGAPISVPGRGVLAKFQELIQRPRTF